MKFYRGVCFVLMATIAHILANTDEPAVPLATTEEVSAPSSAVQGELRMESSAGDNARVSADEATETTVSKEVYRHQINFCGEALSAAKQVSRPHNHTDICNCDNSFLSSDACAWESRWFTVRPLHL